jgi:hypothetical protein
VFLAACVLAYSSSDLDTTRAYASEAVRIARTTSDPDLLAEALAQLTLAHQASGERQHASTAAAELRSLHDQLSNPRAQIMALLGAAQVALANGQPDQAEADATRAREIARRVSDYHRAAASGFWLAYALALGSALPAARATITEAAQDAIRSGYQLLVADNLIAQTSLALGA